MEEQKVIEKTEHTPQVVPAVAPTCTETGLTEGSKCSVCQEVLVPQKTIDAMDHIWDMGDITTAPTCEKDGEKTYHCIVCLATRTEPIDMTVHKLKTTTTAATYAKAGKQETKCTACGKVTNTKVLPKLTVPATTLSKVTTPKSKQLKVTWKKNTKVTGYEVQYSTDKNFKKSAKKVTIKKNKTTSTTIKKLKSKKKYYVRIRTYKTVNGKKYYSAWSKSKNVKVK